MFSDVLHGCFQLKMKCGPAQQLAPRGVGGCLCLWPAGNIFINHSVSVITTGSSVSIMFKNLAQIGRCYSCFYVNFSLLGG